MYRIIFEKLHPRLDPSKQRPGFVYKDQGTAVGGLQPVTVKIPKAAASGGRLFGRLKTSLP